MAMVARVARQQRQHLRLTATVVAEVDDQGIGAGKKAHGVGERLGGDGGIGEGPHIHVADVAGKPGQLHQAEVPPRVEGLHAGELFRWALRLGRRLGRNRLVAVDHPQMKVLRRRLEVLGERPGQPVGGVEAIVPPALLFCAYGGCDAPGDIARKIEPLQRVEGPRDDVVPFGWEDYPVLLGSTRLGEGIPRAATKCQHREAERYRGAHRPSLLAGVQRDDDTSWKGVS
jgi:hypothetical protein